MEYTPTDILEYVLENKKEADFLVAISMHRYGYSIAEIVDLKIKAEAEGVYFRSQSYNLNQLVQDEEIVGAYKAGRYISAFISRFEENYQIHFLIHDCLQQEKMQYENEIVERVVQYMILKTIKQFRMDTPQKVDEYLKL